MAPNDVNFRLSGDSGDAQRAWLELIGILKQTQNEIGKMGRRLETEGKRGTQAMEKQIDSVERLRKSFNMLRNANAVIGGIRTAVNLLTGEMEAAKVAADKLRTPQLNYEVEMAKLLKNVPAADINIMDEMMQAYRGGWSRATIAAAAGAVSSREGLGKSRTEILRATIQAAAAFEERAIEDDPDFLKAIAVGAVSMREADPTLQARRAGRADYGPAIAMMIAGTQAAAQEDPTKFAQNVLPTVTKMVRDYGFTTQDALALAAATQTVAKDPTGRLGSRTLEIAMEQYQVTGRKYGVGVGADGRINIPAVLQWMQTGGSAAALEARQYYTGAFDAAISDSEIANMSITDARGRQMGNARYRSLFKDFLQRRGLVWETYMRGREELDPGYAIEEAQRKQEAFDTSPRFAKLRRMLTQRGFVGRIETMLDTGPTWADVAEYRDWIYAQAGMTGALGGRTWRDMSSAIGRFAGETPREQMIDDIRAAMVEMEPGLFYRPDMLRRSVMDDEWIQRYIEPESQETFRILVDLWTRLEADGMPVRPVEPDATVVPSPETTAGALGE